MQKLFTVSDRGDANLKIINGIRVFSICWVIIGHAFMNAVGAPITNLTTAMEIMDKWYFTLVPGGFFAVDVFFYLSGFLTFYLLTAKIYPTRGKANYPMMYFHRWFRLVTPAGYCILLCVFIFKYFGSGPKYYDSWDMNCSKTWWASLLFINNLYPWETKDMCMGWYWYLANDFEFFLISPVIILLYCLNRYAGYISLGFLHLFNYIYVMVVTAKFDFGIMVTFDDDEDFFHWLYMKPWTRFAAYGVGALFGLAYFEYKTKEKYPEFKESIWTKMFLSYRVSTLISYASFFIGLILTTFFVFIQYDFYNNELEYNNWDKVPNMLFNAFARPGFVLALTLIILPTIENRLTWITTLLSSDFM